MARTTFRVNFAGSIVLLACLAPALFADGPSGAAPPATAPTTAPGGPVPAAPAPSTEEQTWNFHVQNTDIVQGDFPFAAKYSGPNSLSHRGQVDETVTLDLFGGLRLWRGAEAHVDGLVWQGFGLSKTLGIEDFPNADAYKAGTYIPNLTFARLFLRQTFGFGGEQEDVPDGQLTLAGKQDISRLTITLGRFTPTDIVDTNAYAGDPHAQFMNWAMVNNIAFDYAADAVGFSTGIAVELNQPKWALRYTFFQMAAQQNGFTVEDQALMWPGRGADGQFLRSWAMAAEFERRYSIAAHPGAIRFLAWLNDADMATYHAATAILRADGPGADISPAQSYRLKYGLGLNWEQEVFPNVGVFSRLGWNDGREEAWAFSDVNYSASLGVSVKGKAWNRSDDTWGLAGVVSGASTANQRFLEAGGQGILADDGKLNYGWETAMETYYDFKIWQTVHGALDYQFVADPAFNRDRGPVNILGFRLHWGF